MAQTPEHQTPEHLAVTIPELHKPLCETTLDCCCGQAYVHFRVSPPTVAYLPRPFCATSATLYDTCSRRRVSAGALGFRTDRPRVRSGVGHKTRSGVASIPKARGILGTSWTRAREEPDAPHGCLPCSLVVCRTQGLDTGSIVRAGSAIAHVTSGITLAYPDRILATILPWRDAWWRESEGEHEGSLLACFRPRTATSGQTCDLSARQTMGRSSAAHIIAPPIQHRGATRGVEDSGIRHGSVVPDRTGVREFASPSMAHP